MKSTTRAKLAAALLVGIILAGGFGLAFSLGRNEDTALAPEDQFSPPRTAMEYRLTPAAKSSAEFAARADHFLLPDLTNLQRSNIELPDGGALEVYYWPGDWQGDAKRKLTIEFYPLENVGNASAKGCELVCC